MEATGREGSGHDRRYRRGAEPERMHRPAAVDDGPWIDGPWGRGSWRPGPWARGPRRAHPWIPVIVAFILQVPWALFEVHRAVADGENALAVTTLLVAILLALAASFVLAASPRRPGPVVVVVAAMCMPATCLTAGPPASALPFALAVVFAVVRGARPWVWSTVASFAAVAPVFAFALTGAITSIIRPLILALVLCLLAGAGELIRARRERYEEAARQARARRQSAAEAERTRIARELHDVLAHSLSQISVQAGMGLHLFDSRPDRAREALSAIKSTSNEALEEVRAVLGFLRSDTDDPTRAPLPDLARLPALADSFAASGLAVSVHNALDAELSQALQLALYRIIQEALTNARRHGGATTARVELEPTDEGCTLRIVDNGRGIAPGAQPGGGLTGMRERLDLLGGSFSVDEPAGGGFRVTAQIPLPRLADDVLDARPAPPAANDPGAGAVP